MSIGIGIGLRLAAEATRSGAGIAGQPIGLLLILTRAS